MNVLLKEELFFEKTFFLNCCHKIPNNQPGKKILFEKIDKKITIAGNLYISRFFL